MLLYKDRTHEISTVASLEELVDLMMQQQPLTRGFCIGDLTFLNDSMMNTFGSHWCYVVKRRGLAIDVVTVTGGLPKGRRERLLCYIRELEESAPLRSRW